MLRLPQPTLPCRFTPVAVGQMGHRSWHLLEASIRTRSRSTSIASTSRYWRRVPGGLENRIGQWRLVRGRGSACGDPTPGVISRSSSRCVQSSAQSTGAGRATSPGDRRRSCHASSASTPLTMSRRISQPFGRGSYHHRSKTVEQGWRLPGLGRRAPPDKRGFPTGSSEAETGDARSHS